MSQPKLNSLGSATVWVSEKPAMKAALSILAYPLLNGVLSALARDRIPLFMDSIFTAISAALFGPWYGILVAVLTNVWNEIIDGFPGTHVFFALCGIATVLIVHAFARRGYYRTFLSWIACILAVTVANAVLGALIAAFVYGGGTGMNFDYIVSGFSLFTDSVFTAAFLARLPINMVDKALAVAPAFALLMARDRCAASPQGALA